MKVKQAKFHCVLAASFAVAALILFTSFAVAFAQIPEKPVENIYIFDYADLIDSSDEDEMRALAKEIEDRTSAEIVVVTVQTLGSYTIEEYANRLFRSWGIGGKELNNGVLILVNRENLLSGKKGKIRIEVGYGLEGAIPDGKAGRILDEYAIPAFERKKYSKGIKDTFLAVASEVAKEYGLKIEELSSYGIDESGDATSTEIQVGDQGSDQESDIPDFAIFVAVVLIIIFSFIGRRRKRIYWWGQDPWDEDDDHHHFGGFGGFGGFGRGGGGSGGFGGFGGGSSGGGGASR
ncbi:TPM domain-containing protein [Caldicellulosiruptor naganoensis]|uniref:TPM domain-containing protein n=1 Tax=Caldicellulosiruptor naganoensis TaxID=29324 RepID=A0ABY7BJ56_9FIRM|nr:TPM domain-containing protein [Caldicellulosiruptor naganoensis]WAM31596.1 TPM domain-containing protein [Caldicellulosiruptor naganoensis]